MNAYEVWEYWKQVSNKDLFRDEQLSITIELWANEVYIAGTNTLLSLRIFMYGNWDLVREK